MRDLTRREFVVYGLSAVAYVGISLGIWLAGGAPAPGVLGLTLAILCMLLSTVTFTVGLGMGTAANLVIVPMLLLLPPPLVPLLVGIADFAGRGPKILKHRRPKRIVLTFGLSWPVVGPTLLVWLVGVPDGLGEQALL